MGPRESALILEALKDAQEIGLDEYDTARYVNLVSETMHGAGCRLVDALEAALAPLVSLWRTMPEGARQAILDRHRIVNAGPLPEQHTQAVAHLDSALDDAEEVYADHLEAFRWDWGTWGKSALSWRLWASLTPGLTQQDVMGTARFILASRFACDWTPRETALVAQALLEGWQERISRSALTGLT